MPYTSIYDYIMSRPLKLKKLMREHLWSFYEKEQGAIRLCLQDYDCPKCNAILEEINKVNKKYPEIATALSRAWEVQCPNRTALQTLNNELKKVVSIAISTKREYEISEAIELISLILIKIPVFRYEGTIVVGMFHNDTDDFLSLDISDNLMNALYAPFISSVTAILEKRFTAEDVKKLNQVLDLLQVIYVRGETAGVLLLKQLLPTVVLYQKDRNIFVDPVEEYVDTPAIPEELQESTRSELLLFGDIHFYEKGLDRDNLLQSIRVSDRVITEKSGDTDIPYDTLLAVKKELDAPISYITYEAAGKVHMCHIMEYEDNCFLLYQNQNDPLHIYGCSLETKPNTTHMFIEYTIDPEEEFYIKPVRL